MTLLPSSVGDVPVGSKVKQIVGGRSHTCALLESGDVRCWGDNHYGELGYGNTTSIGDDELPSSVGEVDVGGSVVQLTAGQTHTCALLSTGRVRCWGLNSDGQCGYPEQGLIGAHESPSSAGDVAIH